MKNTVLHGVVDDGTREIPIVNKFGKLICNVYIRPSDLSILDRYEELMRDFEGLVRPLENVDINADGTAAFEEGWAVIKSVEAELKKRINTLFDMDEADAIFAKRNAFSSVGGEFFCTRVLNALSDVIVAAVKEESALSQKRMEKYLKDQGKSGGDNAAGSAPENA